MSESNETDTPDTGSSSPGRRSKVSRLIDEYELTGMGETLERRWTADGYERTSLRSLADLFNEALLRSALRDSDRNPLDGEIDNLYRLLQGNDVSSADRKRVIRRLERDGVDVDSLLEEFVSYQAIRTYLQNERNVSYERTKTDRVSATRETIERLRGRLINVADNRLEQLSAAGEVSIGSLSTVVDVRVRCAECGAQYTLDEILDRGSCECSTR